MKFFRCITLCAAAVAATSSAIAASAKTGDGTKDDLLKLYLLSVAADRCGFAMTARQADAIDGAAKSIAERLKLPTSQVNALYSEADIELEKQGPTASVRNGSFAKTFQETLQKMTGP